MNDRVTNFPRRYHVEKGYPCDYSFLSEHPNDIEWSFDKAFHKQEDAYTYADRLSKDEEFVRVVDTEDSK